MGRAYRMLCQKREDKFLKTVRREDDTWTEGWRIQ